MILTDTHTHLYLPEFKEDINTLIEDAKSQGVSRFFLPNINSETISSVFELTAAQPDNCFAMMGLHPCDVKENYEWEISNLENTLAKRTNEIKGVGEIGLDFYWDMTFMTQQFDAFEKQLALASKYNLAVSMHTREATQQTIDILHKHSHLKNRGVFHCFGGTLEQANQIIEMGFYIGIGGVVTFKNSGLDKIVEQLDLKSIVLETDAPYLAPAPHRGKRNVPAYLRLIAEKVALIKNVSLEEVAEITTENSRNIFGC